MTSCPTCEHPPADHSEIAGCLADDCPCLNGPLAAPVPEQKTRAQADAERDEAMGRVQQGTDPAWAAKATAAVTALALRGDEFSTDDVWHYLATNHVPGPREPRALGPIMRAAVRAETIRPVGFTLSVRRHSTPIRTYQAAR